MGKNIFAKYGPLAGSGPALGGPKQPAAVDAALRPRRRFGRLTARPPFVLSRRVRAPHLFCGEISVRKILVTIVGHDRPGIIHQVSQTLADLDCTLFEVSQTTLMGEFAGHFSGRLPLAVDVFEFSRLLGQALTGSDLAHWVTEADLSPPETQDGGECEPYVVTIRGRDQVGIIPKFSGAMAGFDVNIDNLRSASVPGENDFKDGGQQVVLFFELSVPKAVNQRGFRQALNLIAEELEVEMSLQHRDVFEAMHRLL